MYDPKAGRWLSEDPTDFEAGDVNLYRYVGNSPTNATDPSGHAKKPSGSVEPEEALVHATEDRVGYYVGFFASYDEDWNAGSAMDLNGHAAVGFVHAPGMALPSSKASSASTRAGLRTIPSLDLTPAESTVFRRRISIA